MYFVVAIIMYSNVLWSLKIRISATNCVTFFKNGVLKLLDFVLLHSCKKLQLHSAGSYKHYAMNYYCCVGAEQN
jgi:hypothetical protein